MKISDLASNFRQNFESNGKDEDLAQFFWVQREDLPPPPLRIVDRGRRAMKGSNMEGERKAELKGEAAII